MKKTKDQNHITKYENRLKKIYERINSTSNKRTLTVDEFLSYTKELRSLARKLDFESSLKKFKKNLRIKILKKIQFIATPTYFNSLIY